MNVLVAGGAGFIGSAFVRLLVRERSDWKVLVLDKLTYAGNLRNLDEVRDAVRCVQGDIADAAFVRRSLQEFAIDTVVNFAAETHVDRSIMSGLEFIETDVLGTYVLLSAARAAGIRRYVQVSTDEVYGSIPEGAATEEAPVRPANPYSASKTGGDLQVLAAINTYNIPAMITRGSNTYGPYHYPEKMIPLFVTNLLEGGKVPLYGDGKNRREWLYVDDHARGVLTVLERGLPGSIYNLGSTDEYENITVARMILEHFGLNDDWIEYVVDRPGHDRRYALDVSKARALGWSPRVSLPAGLKATIEWYRTHADWWKPVKSGAYAEYYRKQYVERQRAVGNPTPSRPLARLRGASRQPHSVPPTGGTSRGK